MFGGSGFGVGLTVAPLELPAGVPVDPVPVQLSDALPVHARSPEEKAAELQRLQQLEGMLAAYKLDLVAGLAADRPDTHDRRPGQPGAADAQRGPGQPAGVSEFFADELALVLNTSRAAASGLIDQAAALSGTLPGTRAALAEGRLDWPRARAIAAELGWKARATDPRILEEVEAAVLPRAGELSIRRLKAVVAAELTARDAAAADRRRTDAERGVNVVVRPVGDGMSELVAKMPHELATACRAAVDGLARAAKTAGEDRPLGMLRTGALADLVLRPWEAGREPVTAQLTVTAPLDALTPARFLAEGGPVPAAWARPGSVAAPTGEVDGQPITAAHLRALLAQLDAVCPGGLQAPAGGTLTVALTDAAGGLLATTTRAELQRLPHPPHRRPRRPHRRLRVPAAGPARTDRRLRAHRGPAPLAAGPRPHLPAPGLCQQGRLGGSGPRHPVRLRRADVLREPVLPVPAPPPAQDLRPRLDLRPERRRRPHRHHPQHRHQGQPATGHRPARTTPHRTPRPRPTPTPAATGARPRRRPTTLLSPALRRECATTAAAVPRRSTVRDSAAGRGNGVRGWNTADGQTAMTALGMIRPRGSNSSITGWLDGAWPAETASIAGSTTWEKKRSSFSLDSQTSNTWKPPAVARPTCSSRPSASPAQRRPTSACKAS
ncbi:DUF222 domain-containing protein [Geodermatophilus sp. SYSU D00965]